MTVERNNKEVIIRLPATVDTEELQEFLNYARYKKLMASLKISQSEVDELASEVNADW